MPDLRAKADKCISDRSGSRRKAKVRARSPQHKLDSLLVIYKQLHANPELSTQEEQTSAVIAKELRAAGFEVTDHFGRRKRKLMEL